MKKNDKLGWQPTKTCKTLKLFQPGLTCMVKKNNWAMQQMRVVIKETFCRMSSTSTQAQTMYIPALTSRMTLTIIERPEKAIEPIACFEFWRLTKRHSDTVIFFASSGKFNGKPI